MERNYKKLIRIIILLFLILVILLFGYLTYKRTIISEYNQSSTNIELNNTQVLLGDDFANLDQLNKDIHQAQENLQDYNNQPQLNYGGNQYNPTGVIIDYITRFIKPGKDHERTDQYLKIH